MEASPFDSLGARVYAGFWSRLAAGFVDSLLLAPLALTSVWLRGADPRIDSCLSVLVTILVVMYHVYFNARFGGSPGKLAVGLRVMNLDGSRIGWVESWKRASVDIAFNLVLLTAEIAALARIDPLEYQDLPWNNRADLVLQHMPAWYDVASFLLLVWFWSEVVVLLFNKRKRALHDYIAGTVVVMKDAIPGEAVPDVAPAATNT